MRDTYRARPVTITPEFSDHFQIAYASESMQVEEVDDVNCSFEGGKKVKETGKGIANSIRGLYAYDKQGCSYTLDAALRSQGYVIAFKGKRTDIFEPTVLQAAQAAGFDMVCKLYAKPIQRQGRMPCAVILGDEDVYECMQVTKDGTVTWSRGESDPRVDVFEALLDTLEVRQWTSLEMLKIMKDEESVKKDVQSRIQQLEQWDKMMTDVKKAWIPKELGNVTFEEMKHVCEDYRWKPVSLFVTYIHDQWSSKNADEGNVAPGFEWRTATDEQLIQQSPKEFVRFSLLMLYWTQKMFEMDLKYQFGNNSVNDNQLSDFYTQVIQKYESNDTILQHIREHLSQQIRFLDDDQTKKGIYEGIRDKHFLPPEEELKELLALTLTPSPGAPY